MVSLNPVSSNPRPSTELSNLAAADPSRPQLSVVVPIYNELESIPHLLDALSQTLQAANISYEMICVDDGSSDGSDRLLKQKALERSDLRAIMLRRNYGQTAAMAAGFRHAAGQVIVTIDGDLQNDPSDIPLLMQILDDGFDLVSGWRKNRQDKSISRVIPSKIANWLIGQVTGVKLHDYGCSLKAYRAELVMDMNLYGELHRFLPALAFIEGAKITEVPVKHHPRRFGPSKYGLDRTFRVVMDLLTISFMRTFLTRPMHVFGLFGLVFLAVGVAVSTHLAYVRLVIGEDIGQRPLLILAVVLLLAGLNLFSVGILAEIAMRTYHESQGRPIYRVREIVGRK
jgi:glycosyltransferase involved in cell wall biosynthesis